MEAKQSERQRQSNKTKTDWIDLDTISPLSILWPPIHQTKPYYTRTNQREGIDTMYDAQEPRPPRTDPDRASPVDHHRLKSSTVRVVVDPGRWLYHHHHHHHHFQCHSHFHSQKYQDGANNQYPVTRRISAPPSHRAGPPVYPSTCPLHRSSRHCAVGSRGVCDGGGGVAR